MLRPYQPTETARLVEDCAQRTGLSDNRQVTMTRAAKLAAALLSWHKAQRTGENPRDAGRFGARFVNADVLPAAVDWTSELRQLIQLAASFEEFTARAARSAVEGSAGQRSTRDAT